MTTAVTRERESKTNVHRPPAAPTWFHAHNQVWVPFSSVDNEALEEGYAGCRDLLEQRAVEREGLPTSNGPSAEDDGSGWFPGSSWFSKPSTHAAVLPPPPPPPLPNARKTPLNHRRIDPDEASDTKQFRISVLEDRLFDVDLEKMIIFPALWPGFDQGVMRATWFYVSTDGSCSPIACGSAVARDLDQIYEKAKPWELGQRLRLTLNNSNKKKSSTETPTLYDLPSVSGGAKVLFDTAISGRVYTQNFSGKLMAFLWEPLVVLGYENAKEASARVRESKTSSVLANAWSRRGEMANASKQAMQPAASRAQDVEPLEDHKEEDSTEDSQSIPVESLNEDSAPAPKDPPRGTIVENVSTSNDAPNPASSWTSLSEAFMSRARRLRAKAEAFPAKHLGPSKLDKTTDESALEEPAEESDADQEKYPLDDEDEEVYADDLLENIQPNPLGASSHQDSDTIPEQVVFCIHGIGQKYSEDYQAAHFVHDIERLRTTLHQQSQIPDLAQQLSGARIRLIPVCWRQHLDFEPEHGEYKLQDITNDSTIPAVRAVIAKVLLDIPFYLSDHRTAILDAVRLELNRLYRLFLQRNPEFLQRGGKVSILGHSLGSALASDLLSDQPTYVASLNEQDAFRKHLTTPHLLFNVEHFFSVGSPLPLLYYLKGSRLIARRRESSKNPYQEQEDITCDVVGQQGCLAAEQIHNIYAATDPVSFQISATVDAAYARLLRPVEVPRDPALLPRALSQPHVSIGSLLKNRFSGQNDRDLAPNAQSDSHEHRKSMPEPSSSDGGDSEANSTDHRDVEQHKKDQQNVEQHKTDQHNTHQSKENQQDVEQKGKEQQDHHQHIVDQQGDDHQKIALQDANVQGEHTSESSKLNQRLDESIPRDSKQIKTMKNDNVPYPESKDDSNVNVPISQSIPPINIEADQDGEHKKPTSTQPAQPSTASPMKYLRSAIKRSGPDVSNDEVSDAQRSDSEPLPKSASASSSPASEPPVSQAQHAAAKLPLNTLELGERRFLALNPNGCIDYVVDGGSVYQFTQYLDMFRAHMSYWTSPAFGNYILKQLIPNQNKDWSPSEISPPVQEALHILDPTIDSV
ncbi:hypothetical protein MPSI1_003966 [Malassezia psittaci]|uniref:DDHD domain-containing protein n=1 Tax=Malassezia psittaci TaxID=1821823 RepID=A0AAF0JGC2_9BASI|nr:hypothetical protein MPSI1_003966 [Malassezia psittaci]